MLTPDEAMNETTEPVRDSRRFSAVTHAEHRVAEGIRETSRKFASLDRNVQRFVRRKPLTAALAALGVGFVIGRLASRY